MKELQIRVSFALMGAPSSDVLVQIRSDDTFGTLKEKIAGRVRRDLRFVSLSIIMLPGPTTSPRNTRPPHQRQRDKISHHYLCP